MLMLNQVKHLISDINQRVWQDRDADALCDYFNRDILFKTQGAAMTFDQVHEYVKQSRGLGVTTVLSQEPTVLLQGDGGVMVWSEYEMRDTDNQLLQTVESMNQYVIDDNRITSNYFIWNDDMQHIMSHARHSMDGVVSDKAMTNPVLGLAALSARELQCFHALIQGASSKQVARQLSLSPRTVEEHIAKLKSKLKVKTFDQLIDYAMVNDLLQVTPMLQAIFKQSNISFSSSAIS